MYTIGHSNISLEKFTGLLQTYQIEVLVDIRRHPGSNKYPHFDQDSLAVSLPGIEYRWLERLSGRRYTKKDQLTDLNAGLNNKSFRFYADYMQTEQFREGIDELLSIKKRCCLMCSEVVYWRCHRRLVSDFLTTKSREDSKKHKGVYHIHSNGAIRFHILTDCMRFDYDKNSECYPVSGVLVS